VIKPSCPADSVEPSLSSQHRGPWRSPGCCWRSRAGRLCRALEKTSHHERGLGGSWEGGRRVREPEGTDGWPRCRPGSPGWAPQRLCRGSSSRHGWA